VSVIRPPNDISRLHAGRRQARRRRYLALLDLGLGLLAAIMAFLLSPGLAVVAIAAFVVLAVCVISTLLERRTGCR
jgi:Flp pilus assembly protein TadB